MADQYVGEIRMMGCNFAPEGWLTCDGSLLQISEYETLYSLLGTTYGGDGVSTFGIPDLRSRVPVGAGSGPGLPSYTMGQQAGQETILLNGNTIPMHTHEFLAITTAATASNPTSAVPAMTSTNFYSDQQPSVMLDPRSVGSYGGSQPHPNIQPVQAQNFVIATYGLYPSSS